MVACVLVFIWIVELSTLLRSRIWNQATEEMTLLTPQAHIECIFRTPSRRAVGTGVGQQEMTANCTFDSTRHSKRTTK